MLPSSTVKMTRAIPEPKDERTSHRSGASFLVRGIPTGQPNCSVFTSSPMTRLSSFRKLFSHSLTGSLPESKRKKTTGTGRSDGMEPSVSILVRNARRVGGA